MSVSVAIGQMTLDDQIENDLRLSQVLFLLSAFLISLVLGISSTKVARLAAPKFEIPFAQVAFASKDKESNGKRMASASDVEDEDMRPLTSDSARVPELVAQRPFASRTTLRRQSDLNSLSRATPPRPPIVDPEVELQPPAKRRVPHVDSALTVDEHVSRSVKKSPFIVDDALAAKLANLSREVNTDTEALIARTSQANDFSSLPHVPLTINEAVSFAAPEDIGTVPPQLMGGNKPLSLLEMFGADEDTNPSKRDPAFPATKEAVTLDPIAPSVSQLRAAGTQDKPRSNESLEFTVSLPSPETKEEVIAAVIQSKPTSAVLRQQVDEGEKPGPSSNASQEPSPAPILPPRRIVPEPPVRITRQMASLQPRIAKTLRFYAKRPLNTKDDSAWSVMHSILGYGVNGTVAVNGKKGRRTNAVSWMCWNNPCANRRLLYLDGGYIKGLEGPGSQGHPCQFLAMLAQINLKRDYPLRVQGQVFKIEDLINSEMYSCSEQSELTFKLIALSHYLHSDAKWKNMDGEVWDLRRILEIELSQPVNGTACGGTHRVMSIAYAVRTKERRGEPIDGVYARAKGYVRDYQRYAMTLQNRDGSFSSDWFKRRADWGDKDRQLQTTGHVLEWLVYSLPRNELSDTRVVKAVEFLNHLMTRHRYHDWEVGPRGHALRALSLYHQRVFERQATHRVARLEPAEASK